MESTSLSEFFRDVGEWPSGDASLGVLCTWLSRLTEAPFAAVYLLEAGGASSYAYRVLDPIQAERINPEAVSEFLRRQVAQSPGERSKPRLVQIPRESNEPPIQVGASHLAIVAAVAESRSQASTASLPQRSDRLWIFLATSKAPSLKDELVTLAFVEHLEHLGEAESLRKMIALRNQFLSIASHELKTPLTSIYGMLQLQERMLRMKRTENSEAQQEKQHSFLIMVIRQVERLNELIDGLLDVSRIQAGRFAVDPAETDVASLLKEAVANRLTPIANDAGVRLISETPDRLHAWVDPLRMEEVITNLVMNAIRFSPEGGAVWIRLSHVNTLIRLTVRDQGPAVPLEDRDRIFQPFERAQRTARLGGLGLGLFISRQIAQLHGGNVSLVESVPGKGNVFEASFPLRSSTLVSA